MATRQGFYKRRSIPLTGYLNWLDSFISPGASHWHTRRIATADAVAIHKVLSSVEMSELMLIHLI